MGISNPFEIGLNEFIAAEVPKFLGLSFWFVAAIIVIIVGWFLGVILKSIVSKVLNILKLDDWAKDHNLVGAVGGLPLSSVVGSFVKWYTFFFVFALALGFIPFKTIEVFSLTLYSMMLKLLGALVLVVLGLIVAKIIENKINQTSFKKKKVLSKAVYIITVFLATVLGLKNAGFDVALLETAFLIAIGTFMFMAAIIVGISFGLSFKDEARQLVDDMKKDLK
ncbi:MAG: hypothetical protein ABIA76_00715 [Candidatus Diapherotrites archaeon]